MRFTINIKIEKRHIIFLAVLVCMVFVIGVFAVSSPVGHDPEEIGSGTFGGTDYTFPGNVNIQQTLTAGIITLGGVSRTTWPPVVLNMTAPNIIAGMFGANVGGGDFGFPRDVNVTRNIILGGVARGTWPKETFNLSAENISAGTFGARMGGGSYRFPQNLNVSENISAKNANISAFLYSGNITVVNNISLGGVSRGTWPGIVKILTGEVSQGQYLPNPPAGYQKSDCAVSLSLASLYVNRDAYLSSIPYPRCRYLSGNPQSTQFGWDWYICYADGKCYSPEQNSACYTDYATPAFSQPAYTTSPAVVSCGGSARPCEVANLFVQKGTGVNPLSEYSAIETFYDTNTWLVSCVLTEYVEHWRLWGKVLLDRQPLYIPASCRYVMICTK